MADKSLSTYAHNVKIISQNGTVTLKGPVRSDDEVRSIVYKANDVTRSSFVYPPLPRLRFDPAYSLQYCQASAYRL
jgi:hypothetical protein